MNKRPTGKATTSLRERAEAALADVRRRSENVCLTSKTPTSRKETSVSAAR